jgi:hypothetical protein
MHPLSYYKNLISADRILSVAFFSIIIRDKKCAGALHDFCCLLIPYTVLVFRFTHSCTTVLTVRFSFSQT